MVGLEELAGRGGVADGGLLVDAEHHGQVQRVGSAGQRFLGGGTGRGLPRRRGRPFSVTGGGARFASLDW